MAEPLNEKERDELIAYLDGELTESEARAIEGKLNRDPRIRAEAEAMRRTWELLDYLPRPEASASFTHRTLNRVTTIFPASDGRRDGRRWLLGLSWSAALVLATLAGYAAAPLVIRRSREPENTDQQLVQDQRLLERLRFYQNVDDIIFLGELDQYELFGDEHAGF